MISMTLPQYRRHECTIYGRIVRLIPLWAETLAVLLVSSPHQFVSRLTLIEALWPNPDLEPDYAHDIVYKNIHFLRKSGVPIENDWNFGWRIPCHAREAEPVRLAA